ncbi:ribosomal-processing cysteine protease Prp [Orenia marismortui]|uniref:Ribosomal processing cysteine protease Prp n=1 Tax=Orenia marismortui TaxID=46469 RepID=A0A4R8GVI2_9FIRM|nr:ribosomal-processing cysteine protease Prp [Orenia marismortui]TDX49001.1 hypothetical protein C7959_12215 [Orenia marismortui]
MITININRNQEGNVVSFFGDGHAEYAEYGQDIVCAAVSAIMQTAVFGLTNYLDFDINIDVKDGWLKCKIDSNIAKDLQVKSILETMVIGLKETEKSYSQYLKIVEGGGKND